MTEAILGFAADCQLILSLDQNPASALCQEADGLINFWDTMGEICEPACLFGTRQSSTSCECMYGYWGTTCDKICPGGANQPCSGFGTCDQLSGECNCPISRLSSDDCSVCFSSWYGPNCEFAINDAYENYSHSVAIAGRLGHIYSLDGISFFNPAHGEYVLLAISSNVIIEGKFVTCYQNFTCLPFIAARIGDISNGFAAVTVQARRTYNSKPRVYINGIETVLDTPAYFEGFTVSRSSFLEVNFEVTNHFSFQIYVEGQYLQLTIKLPNSILSKTSGLMSGNKSTLPTSKLAHLFEVETPYFDICNNVTPNQINLASSSSTSLVLDSFSQTTSSQSELDMTRFTVENCDNFIHYPTAADQLQTVGGYNLYFDKTSVFSSLKIDSTIYPEIAIELMVKQHQNASDGVLFSFSNDIVFMVVSGQMSIEIHTYTGNNITVQESNVTLEERKWNKIIFSYYSTSGILDMYVVTEAGAIIKRDFVIYEGIFNTECKLSLGHWYPPSNGMSYSEPSAFRGELDNFVIWGLAIESNQVNDLFQMDPNLAFNSLLFSLQFDEGDGTYTQDGIGHGIIDLPQFPWIAPDWVPSDLIYTRVSTPEIDYFYFTNYTLEEEANNFCSLNLLHNTMLNECLGLNNGTRYFFYLTCMHSVAATGDTTAGYNTILELFRICNEAHTMPSTAITALCAQLNVKEINGTTCSSSCKFGFSDGSGGCTCAKGYYGTQCDSVCPGDSDNPCSNHGDCQTDGTCHCWWNWQGDPSCSSCSLGVSGSDCTVLDTSSLSSGSEKVAAVSCNGYYMTFGGQQISFIGETGAFLLFSSYSLNIDIHVYQVSCHYGSCIAAVSVSTTTTSVVVTPPGQGYSPIVYKDGIKTGLDEITNQFDASLTIRHPSLTEIEITATAIGSIKLHILVQEQFLQVSVITASTICQDGAGIFGTCSIGAIDYSVMPLAEVTAYILSNFKLNSSVILDTLKSPPGSATTTGFALKFNGTAVKSDPLAYSSEIILDNKDFSISLYFKPSAFGGCLLSYAKDVTFSLINDQPFRIEYHNVSVNTAITPILNEWNQIILTFRRSTKQIDFFHFCANNKVAHQILELDCPSVFSAGGIIMLGEWLPSTGSGKYIFGDPYQGFIDDITIWKEPIKTSLIYQAHRLNVKLSGFTISAACLFTFSEGVGTVAFDVVNGNNIVIPQIPWQSPEWEISDLSLSELRTITSEIYTSSIDDQANLLCDEFFDNAAIASSCTGIDPSLQWWYKQMCKITASNSGYLSDTTLVMADYTSLCSVTSGSTQPVNELICNLNVTLPDWLSQKCSGCEFGYLSNGKCTCYYGYWGDNCTNTCKGGATNPCNGNGVCDISGYCQCYGRFNGDQCEPGICESNWEGTDCTIVSSTFTPLTSGAEILVAQVNLIGQVSGFDGTIIDIRERSYINLMTVLSLDIAVHGRFSICESDSALHMCLIGIILEHSGDSYYITYKGYTGSSVVIEAMTHTLMVYDTLTIGNATVELTSPTTIEITFSHLDLRMKLSSVNSRLMLTISIMRVTWDALLNDITGVLTACNTSKAITAVKCSLSRSVLCNDTGRVIPESCAMPLSVEALSYYINEHLYTNLTVQAFIENMYVAAMESNCLLFSSTGVTVNDLSLPNGDFTLELHVKPKQSMGIVLTFVKDTEYFILVNSASGLLVVVAGVYYKTELNLEINVWNQISLAWRSDVSIMEVYLTDNAGNKQHLTRQSQQKSSAFFLCCNV